MICQSILKKYRVKGHTMLMKHDNNFVKDYKDTKQWCNKCSYDGQIMCWRACGQGSALKILFNNANGITLCGHCDKFTDKNIKVTPLKKLALIIKGFSYSR